VESISGGSKNPFRNGIKNKVISSGMLVVSSEALLEGPCALVKSEKDLLVGIR
jgi:hypothetical protein